MMWNGTDLTMYEQSNVQTTTVFLKATSSDRSSGCIKWIRDSVALQIGEVYHQPCEVEQGIAGYLIIGHLGFSFKDEENENVNQIIFLYIRLFKKPSSCS